MSANTVSLLIGPVVTPRPSEGKSVVFPRLLLQNKNKKNDLSDGENVRDFG